MSLSGKAPWIEVETSVFASDWMAALDDPSQDDVTFVLASGKRLRAHKIILAAASRFFSKIVGIDDTETQVTSILY